MGYTENKILIHRDFDHVFDLTNKIELWPQLFTEYRTAEIISREGNEIIFKLETFPEHDRPARSWVSKRTILKDEALALAERIDSTFPFKKMLIRWEYEKLPSDAAVLMTWIQEFSIHPDCHFSIEQMESFLNKNTRAQMKAVKHAVENWEPLNEPDSIKN